MEENTSKVYVGTTGLINPPAGGSGSALFVINLCASIAPVPTSGKNLPGLDNYRLYQVARVEDGRTRHRLRLGFFTSESHAESVLTVVRQQYPTAFTTCLCDEDRKFARGYLPEPAAPAPSRPVAVASTPTRNAPPPAQPAAARPAANKVNPPAAAARPASTAPVTSPPASPAARTLSRAEPQAIELTWEPDTTPKAPPAAATPANAAKPAASAVSDKATKPAPAISVSASSTRVPALSLAPAEPTAKTKAPGAAKPNEPFHVGKGVDIADAGITLTSEPASAKPAAPPAQNKSGKSETPASRIAITHVSAPAPKPTPKSAAAPKPVPAATVTRQPAKPAVIAPSLPAVPAHPAKPTAHPPQHLPLPDLDSTQTIRALTSAELKDDAQEKWFAIQLAASEQPVNLDAMPRLDIFEAYRLYSVAIAGSGKIVHSLRLGFFKEAVSAEAVSGYLKTFFGSPSVLRVSVAEHARFKDAPLRKADADDTLKHEAKVVELNNVRGARPVVPTVTMEVPAPNSDTSATGSFRMHATGTHKTLTPTLKPAAKTSGTATKRAPSGAHSKTSATGKHKALPQPKKSLKDELLEEAREWELSESGIRKLPKNDSLLSRLVGKLTK
jgi:hypothetical protein